MPAGQSITKKALLELDVSQGEHWTTVPYMQLEKHHHHTSVCKLFKLQVYLNIILDVHSLSEYKE